MAILVYCYLRIINGSRRVLNKKDKRKLVVKLYTSVTELYCHILTGSKKMSNVFVTLQKAISALH